jgi:hypothetical protein
MPVPRVFSSRDYTAPVHPHEETPIENGLQFDYTGVIAFSPSIEPAESDPAQLLFLRVARSVVGSYHFDGLIFTLRRIAS